MSLLTLNSTPAERRRGCVFSELFRDNAKVLANGGTISGAPVIYFGATFNGTTDGIVYALSGNEYNSPLISIVCEFTPHFAYDVNTQRYLFDSSDSVGGNNRFRVYKMDNANSNVLKIELNGTEIAAIASATYAAYWLQNQRNVLVISGDATNDLTNVWLNGTQILTDDATAWASASNAVVEQDIGTSYDTSLDYDGVIHSFKVFQSLLSEAEAIDYYNNSTYNYRNEALVDLPMTAATHDTTNTRTLDVSGNGFDATFGDGSTSTTYPTKLAGRGYDFNLANSQYLNLGNVADFDNDEPQSISFLIKTSVATSLSALVSKSQGGGAGYSGWQLYLEGADTALLVFRIYDTSITTGIKVTGDIKINDGLLHNVVITYDGSQTAAGVKMYVDTVENAYTANVDTGFAGSTLNSADLNIGRTTYGSLPLDGEIYNYKQFSTVLTPTQIADMSIEAFASLNQI